MSIPKKEKLAVSEQRIIELKTLINDWQTSNISSRRSTIAFVDAVLADRQQTKVG